MSDTQPNVDEQPQHNLEDVVYDMLSETFCPDCDHPRCKGKVELYTRALQSIIAQARIDEVENIVTDVIANDNYHEHNDSVGLYMKKKYQDRLKELRGNK